MDTSSSSGEDSDNENYEQLLCANSMRKHRSIKNDKYFATYFSGSQFVDDTNTFPSYETSKEILRSMADRLEEITRHDSDSLHSLIMSHFDILVVSNEETSQTGVRLHESFKARIDNALWDLPNPYLHGEERLMPGTKSLGDIHYSYEFHKKQLHTIYSILKVYSDYLNDDNYATYTLVPLVDKVREMIQQCHMILYSTYSLKETQRSKSKPITAPTVEWNLTQDMRSMTQQQYLLMKFSRDIYPYKLDRATETLFKEKKVHKHVPVKCKIPVNEFGSPLRYEGALIELDGGNIGYGTFQCNDEVFIHRTEPVEDKNISGYAFKFRDGQLYPVEDTLENDTIIILENGEEVYIDSQNQDEYMHLKVGDEDSNSGSRVSVINYPDGSAFSGLKYTGIYVHSYICCHGKCRKTMNQHMTLENRMKHVFKMKTVIDEKVQYGTRYYEEYMELGKWIGQKCDKRKDFAAYKIYTQSISSLEYFKKKLKEASSSEVRPRNIKRELWSFLNGVLYRGDLDMKKPANQITFPRFYPYECKCVDDDSGSIDFNIGCDCGSVRCLPTTIHNEYKEVMETDSNNFFDMMFPEELMNPSVICGPRNRCCSVGICGGHKYSEHMEPNARHDLESLDELFVCSFCGKEFTFGEDLPECEGDSDGNMPKDGLCFPHKLCISAYTQFRTPFLDSIFLYQDMTREDIMWMKALIGRMLFPLGVDSWEIVTWLIGRPQTGKSVLTKILQAIFPKEMVGTISNNTQGLFGLGVHLKKFMLVGSELGSEFAGNIDSCVLQAMCSGERCEFAKKHKDAIDDYWKLPMFFCGNLMPNVMDNNGSIFRRLVTTDFHKNVTGEDDLLLSRVKSEFPSLLVSCSSIYLMLAKQYRRSRPPLTQRFEKTRIQLMGVCSPFERFISSDQRLVKGDHTYIREEELHRLYRRFTKENDIHGAPDVTKHTTIRGVIGPNLPIKQFNGPLVWPPIATDDAQPKMDGKNFRYYRGVGLYEHFPAEPTCHIGVLKDQLQLFMQENPADWFESLKTMTDDISN